MTFVRVRGFKIFKDRHGKWRCYHRKTNVAVDLEKNPMGSAEFLAECKRIAAIAEHGASTKPGTLGALIKKYKEAEAWTDLQPRTQSDYEKVFAYLTPLNDVALKRFTTAFIFKLRDKASRKRGRRFANYVRTVIALVFAWGRPRGYIKVNTAKDIPGLKRPKSVPAPNRPWADEERFAVLEAMQSKRPQMLVPLTLMMFCGFDPADALALPKSALKDGMINTQRAKTGEPVWLPAPQPVLDAIEQAPEHDAVTIAANSKGIPWTYGGYSKMWQRERANLVDAGKVAEGLTLKGLRHTVATILAEMGCDDRTIADMLGQRTIEMAQHYSKRANRTRKMKGVVKNFEEELDRRRTKSVKPS